ncbi:SGNH/GDSL hydrolase family protein [Nitrospira tepida]|uniref:SGNH/GDSL hydrolase family protein n=1 Tax=Nitrospira tepida TaxID=2973512 RepID=UPI00351ED497
MSAIVGEVLLRSLGYAGAPESQIGNIRQVNDPILNWRFIPNSRVQDGKIVLAYNSAGFRDREHARQKQPGVRRVIVLGDSVTEGAGVESEAMFSSRLQDLLGSQYEVINLGMSGLNTPQEVHVLEVEGLGYDPDLVIVNFVLNDCDFFPSSMRPSSSWRTRMQRSASWETSVSIPESSGGSSRRRSCTL